MLTLLNPLERSQIQRNPSKIVRHNMKINQPNAFFATGVTVAISVKKACIRRKVDHGSPSKKISNRNNLVGMLVRNGCDGHFMSQRQSQLILIE